MGGENISAREREREEGGSTCTRSGIKSGMSLCLEKEGDEEMEGGFWNEVSWRVVESPGNKDRRGRCPGSLAKKQRKQSSLASTTLE